MTFKHPNFKDSTAKNAAHVNYIATRSGVDKSVTESDLNKELEKGIEKIPSDDEVYLKYIDERPRSHGLFGAEGIEDLDSIRKEISECESFVWRGIISLREEDAQKLGYLSKDKWQDFLRKKMPDIADEMGIRITNFKWVAAIHMEKGHPHAHIMFWEKNSERTIGTLKNKGLDNIRKILTDEVFEDERLQLTNEKNAMRDLIRDLAKNDVGEAARILKEVRNNVLELRTLIPEMNKESVPPRLYDEEESSLADKIKKLSGMLPGSGRAMLKFMPQDVKDELRAISEFILKQPDFAASLERNLKAVEDLTRMYTGKEEAIQKARDNAYNDIRDRVCQIILRGAVESLRDNQLYIDGELANNFVSYIENLNNQINLIPEKVAVINQIAISLLRTGHTDENVQKLLSEYTQNEGLGFKDSHISKIITDLRESGAAANEINMFSSVKKIDFMLSNLKLSKYSETEAFDLLRQAIKQDAKGLEGHLQRLCDDGYLKFNDNIYQMTEKGMSEFLIDKKFDNPQKVILKSLENGEKSFNDLINNQEVFGSMLNKDQDEFKISKFDLKVHEEFGDDNKITLKELEEKIYEKYSGDEDIEKAEREFDIIKNRIEKLCLNGFAQLDKETDIYSFTQEGIEELKNITGGMEFTRYDANLTLSYLDKTEGILKAEDLKKILNGEIVNQRAKILYEKSSELLDSVNAKEYINVDDNGNITATKQGKNLSYQLQKVIKYFNQVNGPLNKIKLKELCSKEFKNESLEFAEEKYEEAMTNIKEQVDKGNVIQLKDGSYIVDPLKHDIKNLLYQINKEGGSIHKDNLKDVFEKNIPNRESENQYKYLIKRLDNLKEQGYLSGEDKEYRFTDKGIQKREDLLKPERGYLKKELGYLKKLGFIDQTESGYIVTEKYFQHIKNRLDPQKSNTVKKGVFGDEVIKLIDKSYDRLEVKKIERINQRLANGRYINGDYSKIPSDYKSLREFCHVEDTVSKTLNKLSTALLVSGVSVENVKIMLHSWNERSMSQLDPEKINEIIDKSNKNVEDDRVFGRLTVVSKSEWEKMFKDLGVKDPPQWIYKGYGWKEFNHAGMGMFSIINDIWKSAWKTMEQQRLQSEAQAEMLKKKMLKQQATENKSAMVEQIRKNKDKSAMHDNELDI